ncbi:MAG TPA: helix-turn-helix transcriptional regulator [Candidatus Hydrogenedentes bacterium]|nr:helix-turn-helix transcriptional regulator [Candidatus Hydrogenedentota bacterium]HIJ72811.1 helix-turn-helix transcriptional regulator [Candidatus Hydrogenedentota bacterium]
MTSNKELMGAGTGLLVLSVLAREASYGYQIIRRINDEAAGLFVWQEGTVYPLLHKLEKDGFVRTQWQQADTGRRRKYYYITAKGREALSEGHRQWHAFHHMVTRFVEATNGQSF